MDVDFHNAQGAAASTAAEPAAAAAGGDSGGGLGVSGRQQSEAQSCREALGQGIQIGAAELSVAAIPKQDPPQEHPSPTSLVPDPSLQVGDRVEIHGLLSSPELNGRRGRIASFVKETSRVEVRLEGDETTKGVRATKLRKVVPLNLYPHRTFSRWETG